MLTNGSGDGLHCKSNSINTTIKDSSFPPFDNLQKCANELYESLKEKRMSHWKGDTSEPLQHISIGQLLEQSVDRFADRTAISFLGGQKLTYTEVLEKVDTLAAAFLTLGLKKGDHIAIWGYNTVEWYLSFLAGFRAGLIVVNLNPLYQAPELLACLTVGDVKALIMDEKLNDRNFYDVLKSAIPDIQQQDCDASISCKNTPLLKIVIMLTDKSYNGTHKWTKLFNMAADDQKQRIKHIQSEIGTFDVCNIQFTSGTTSHPKGVLLTHHNLINNGNFIAKNLGLYDKAHRVCVQVPFFHAYGAVAGIMGIIQSGANMVLASVKFSPNKSIDCVIEEKCTVIYGTPTMYVDLLTVTQKRAATDPQIYDKMSCLERFFTGGAICLPEILIQLKNHFKNAAFTSGYGMTETSPVTFMSQKEDSLEVLLNAVGRVMAHTEVKVVDENNQIVPLGTPGEMCFRGYVVMKGYYKEPEKTKEVLTDDGWFHSGDKFVLLENGYAQIVGRIKEIIIRGGENIEPKEIESCIIQHSDIIDVQVYGVSDSRLGEAVAAAIVKKEYSQLTEEEVKNYCKDKIAPFKIPQHVIFVDEFPKTASGKVQKFKLRKITEDVLKEKK